MWSRTKPVPLESATHNDSRWSVCAAFAYDKEYLYLAIRCQKSPHGRYEAATGTRTHDADLSGQDRVEILLDSDRDYVTAYLLAFDSRGRMQESCGDDATWNPTMYVAVGSDDAWTIEAALPWNQVAETSPSSRDIWAISLRRIVPGTGEQHWPPLNALEVGPEKFAWLFFE